LSHWELGRFDLARVNPPLVRMVAALPVTLAAHEVDWTQYTAFPGGRPEFAVGVDFMRANRARSFWLFTLARWACIPFSLLGAYVCYRWARELYGELAGCLGLSLWCFCPNILAHAELITSDVAAAAFGSAACYAFWRWLREPALDTAWICGLLLGLAELTKTTWLLLFPLWPLLWIVARCARMIISNPKSKIQNIAASGTSLHS
ncbi:MAG: ArnT family glycosyltransferase, partial [Pirellulales bacterium]